MDADKPTIWNRAAEAMNRAGERLQARDAQIRAQRGEDARVEEERAADLARLRQNPLHGEIMEGPFARHQLELRQFRSYEASGWLCACGQRGKTREGSAQHLADEVVRSLADRCGPDATPA